MEFIVGQRHGYGGGLAFLPAIVLDKGRRDEVRGQKEVRIKVLDESEEGAEAEAIDEEPRFYEFLGGFKMLVAVDVELRRVLPRPDRSSRRGT